MNRANKRILISGASIAGPTLAYWLNRYGFDVTLVERAKTLRTGGYPIDVRAAALDVIERMGIFPDVRAAHVDTQRLTFLDSEGEPFAILRPEQITGGQEGRDLEVPRGALTSLLFEVTRRDIDYRFGESILSITQHDTRVLVTFLSGVQETFDIIIGADGLHSNTRRLIFGPESQFERYLGYCYCASTLPNDLKLAHEALIFNMPGKAATLYAPAKSSVLYALMSFKHTRPADTEGLNTEYQRKLVADVFANGHWEIPRMIDAMMKAEDFFFDTMSQIHMPRWSAGRVALTGDAAHAPSFLSGQGSSMALISAYVLAGELASDADHSSAFAAYERVSRHYIEANQAMATGGGAVMIPETAETLRVRNLALQAAAAGGPGRLHGGESRPIINSFRLPDYDARSIV